MGSFHVFKIVQMVLNRAKRLICGASHDFETIYWKSVFINLAEYFINLCFVKTESENQTKSVRLRSHLT